MVPELKFENVYHTTASIDGEEKYDLVRKEHNLPDRMNLLVTNYYEWIASADNFRLQTMPEYNVGLRPKQFVCLNKVERYHRIRIVAWLLKNNMLDKGLVSFYGRDFDNSWIEVAKMWADSENYRVEPKWIIDSITENSDKFPMNLNASPDRENPIELIDDDHTLYNQTYYSIVPETMFFCQKHGFNNLHTFADSHFISEKTYKTLAIKHPFILMGWPKTMEHLRSLGYKTFHPYINEDYDNEIDDFKRFDLITREIERLNNFTDQQWIEFTENIKPIVEHNFNVLMGKNDFAITKNITKDW